MSRWFCCLCLPGKEFRCISVPNSCSKMQKCNINATKTSAPFFICKSKEMWSQMFPLNHKFESSALCMNTYFDFVSWHRQQNVPLVLFSTSLWDQLSKILNRDLVFPFFAAAAFTRHPFCFLFPICDVDPTFRPCFAFSRLVLNRFIRFNCENFCPCKCYQITVVLGNLPPG